MIDYESNLVEAQAPPHPLHGGADACSANTPLHGGACACSSTTNILRVGCVLAEHAPGPPLVISSV